jgi:hypothetical protein
MTVASGNSRTGSLVLCDSIVFCCVCLLERANVAYAQPRGRDSCHPGPDSQVIFLQSMCQATNILRDLWRTGDRVVVVVGERG